MSRAVAALCVAQSVLWAIWITPVAVVIAQQSRTGSSAISGTVVSDEADGRPLRRAVVMVSGRGLQPARIAIADDAGRFAFRSLPSGNVTLEAIKPGYVSTRYGQKRPGRGAGVVLSLGVGEAIQNLVVRMPRGAAITGTITDEAGRPRRNVQVTVFESRVVNGARRLTTVASSVTGEFVRPMSDDRGVFRAYGLPPGDYVVSASLSGVGDLGPGLDLRRVNPAELQWAAEQIRSGNTGSPIPGAVVAPEPGPAPRPGQRVGLATVFYPGTTDASAAVPVTLGRGEERSNVDLVIGFVATSRAEGRVVSSDGQPVAGVQITARRAASVVAYGPFMGPTMTRSSAEGTFSLGNLAPGAYTLLARSAGGRGAGSSAGLWASAEIAVNGDDVTGLTLVLQPGLTLTGRVVFSEPAGAPAPDLKLNPIRVSLNPVNDGPTQTMSPITQMNDNGTFMISGIVPGRYRLVAGGPNRGNDAAEERWVLHSSTIDSRDIADLPLEMSGTPLAGAVVTLRRRLAEISGTLLDAAGRPSPDYFVVVFSTNREHWLEGSRRVPAPVRPSSNGTYQFAALPAGTYYLAALTDVDPEELFDRAFLEQVAAGALTITLADGETKLQDLKLAGQTPGQ